MEDEYILKLPEEKRTIVYVLEKLSCESTKQLNLLKILKSSKEDETVEIEMNSDGGDLFMASIIVSHILKTKANVICNLHIAQSSAGLVALACDVINPMPFSMFMAHEISWSSTGSITTGKARYDFATEYYYQFMEKLYSTFLTPEEFEQISKSNKTFFFTETQIKERLKNFIPLRIRNSY